MAATKSPNCLLLILFKYGKALCLILLITLMYLFYSSQGGHLLNKNESSKGSGSVGVVETVVAVVKASSEEEGDWLNDVRYVESNLYTMAQDDPRLVKYVRYRYLSPPATEAEKYNLKDPAASSDHTELILKLFKNKRNGTFMESGANDGEASNTLKLEKEFGWTGVLIECNPTVVPYLKSKRRRAWVAGVCLATLDKPQKVNFSNPVSWTYSGRFGKPWELPIQTNWTFFDVETIPLYTILEAIPLSEIDFWSFDVEGSEMQILKTIPFDKISIKVIICEIYFYDATERAELDQFMETKGYRIYPHTFSIDKVYVHSSFVTD